MSNKFMALFALAVVMAAILAQPTSASEARVRIAVTVPLLAPMAAYIGGSYVEVDQLVPPGVDPHTYSPPASIVGRLNEYDVIVMSGPHHMKIEDVIMEWRREGLIPHPAILYYSNYTECGMSLLEMGGHVNPHGYWWGPKSLAAIALCLGKALASIDPRHSSWYEARARLYASQAEALAGSLEGLRVASYSPIVQYFVEESGGRLVYIAAPSPSAGPVADAVSRIVEMRERGEVDVFIATRVDELSSRAAARLVADLRERGVPALILPLGEPGSDPLLTVAESIGALRSTGAPLETPPVQASGGLCGCGVALASFLAGLVVMAAWVRRA